MLLFCDSGDHHSGMSSSGKWTSSTADFNPNSYAGLGRFGTNPVMWGWTNRGATKALGASYQEVIMGAAIRFSGDGNFSNHNLQFFGFQDSGTEQLSFFYDKGQNLIKVYRGFGGTLLDTLSYTFYGSQYVFVEARAKIDNAAGEWDLYIDGDLIGSGTGLDTQNTGNASLNEIVIGHGSEATDVYYDDLYVLETAGGGNDTFLGDVRVECLFPNGNGAHSDLIGSDTNSTDNYLLVDETTPNDDTDYVESDIVGDLDTYTYTNLTPTTGTVYGVQILPDAKKTDTGARSIASVARVSATDEDGPDKTLTSSYLYRMDIRETKPGGGAWTISDVNGAEFGAKVTV